MGWSTSVIAPPDGNMGDYMRSLEKLIARDDAILYPTHGSPIRRAARRSCAPISPIGGCAKAQIATCLARGDDTIAAIVARLYAGLAPVLVPGGGADGAGASGTYDGRGQRGARRRPLSPGSKAP